MAYVPDQNLVQIGKDCISLFHNESVIRFENYKVSLNELYDILTKRKGGKAFLEGLGLGIKEADISVTKQNLAMKALAKKAQGKIPSNNSDFFNALIDISQVTTFEDIGTGAWEILKGSAADIGVGVQKIGDTTLTVGKNVLKTAEGVSESAISISKNLSWILPAIAFLVIGIFAYSMSKKV